MSLNVALQIAQNSLGQLSRQTATVARNVTDSGNANYVRRDANMVDVGTGSRVQIVRAQLDAQLVRANREAISSGSAQTVLADSLADLGTLLGSPNGEGSVHQAIGRLSDAMQVWSSDPSNDTLAGSGLNAARTVVSTINGASNGIDALANDNRSALENDIDQLNTVLRAFQQADADVVAGEKRSQPDLDAADQRDALLRSISSLIDVSVAPQKGGSTMLLTKDGTTLFETTPRQVGLTGTGTPLSVSIDGVALRTSQGAATTARGSVMARLQFANTVLPEAQTRLDNVAQGLVDAFSETGTGVPDAAGLFTAPGGLASTFAINSAYDPGQGGNFDAVRDGGTNGAAYLTNTSGADGFSGRLIAVTDNTSTPWAKAIEQSGWIDGLTSDATREAASRDALSARLTDQLQQQGGVDIDGELARLLELERGYEASARMIATADAMLATLLQATR